MDEFVRAEQELQEISVKTQNINSENQSRREYDGKYFNTLNFIVAKIKIILMQIIYPCLLFGSVSMNYSIKWTHALIW